MRLSFPAFPRLNLRTPIIQITGRINGLIPGRSGLVEAPIRSSISDNRPMLRSFYLEGRLMALKQTHIYRGHAIVHHVFATDQTDEKIERFTVSVPGKSQLCTKSTLTEAKQSVDEILTTPARRYALNST